MEAELVYLPQPGSAMLHWLGHNYVKPLGLLGSDHMSVSGPRAIRQTGSPVP